MSGCDAPEGDKPMMQFSNDNLLKMCCHDKFRAGNAMKKTIEQAFPRPSPEAPLLPGLVRFGKAPKSDLCYLSFATEEDREAAAVKLVTLQYRGKPWERRAVTENDLKVTHGGGSVKRKRDGDNAGADGRGGARKEGSSIAPWAEVAYEEQIKRKTQHCEKVMKAIYMNQRTHKQDNLYLNIFGGVHQSRLDSQYRNHVKFTFGYGRDGAPTVGFLEGALVDGAVGVMPVTDPSVLCTSHVVAVAMANRADRMARTRFPQLSYMDKRINSVGFWRYIQVRHNVDQEVMIDVEMDTQAVSGAVLRDVVAALAETFGPEPIPADEVPIPAEGRPWRIVSLQYHHGRGTRNAETSDPRTIIRGDASLKETVHGLKFDLAPTAFFQVNTPGMELMIDRVAEQAGLTSESILLDLCCGTGTIGLCLANRVKRVIGVEMVADSVANAKRNAQANNITNAEHICSKLEDCLEGILRPLVAELGPNGEKPHIVAILDPPRAGVHPSVVKSLRATSQIDHFVYISCDQRAIERDGEGFTKDTTNKFVGEPFRVTCGFGIDLFPHTPHVEFVGVFKRGEALKREMPAASDEPVKADEE